MIAEKQQSSLGVAAGTASIAQRTAVPRLDLARLGLRAWNDAGICHGFLGRAGGVSRRPYESLNFSSVAGDDPDCVAANWQRLRDALPAHMEVSRSKQVHGSRVQIVGKGNLETLPVADGQVTGESGILLTVLTADCVPILMLDPRRRICGAFHAGWRGVLAGIAAEGVRMMTQLGAVRSDLRAALGPSIGACCFEVDFELADRFIREIPRCTGRIRNGGPGKAFVDLKAAIKLQLEATGIDASRVTEVGPCTCCAKESYFSYRAAKRTPTGLQLTFIGLEG